MRTILTLTAALVVPMFFTPSPVKAQAAQPLVCTYSEALAKIDNMIALTETLEGTKKKHTKKIIHNLKEGLEDVREELVKGNKKPKNAAEHYFEAADSLIDSWDDLDHYVAKGKIANVDVAQQLQSLFCDAERCIVYLYYPEFDYQCF